MRNLAFVVVLVGLVAATSYTSNVLAGEWIKPGEETVKIKAGGFFPAFDTKARLGLTDIGDADVDLEDDLGLEDHETTFYGKVSWRIAPRHRLSIGYFTLDRDSQITALVPIDIGDGQVIAAGASVFTNFKLDIFPVAYSYSFYKRPNQELAFTIGLNWQQAELAVDASAWLEDNTGSGRISGKADLPVPLIGLTYDYFINDRWSVGLVGQVFGLDLDNDDYGFSGTVYNVGLSTEYWIWNNFGVGAAVDAFGLAVDIGQDDWQGRLEYDYWGPQLYLTGRF